MQYLIDNEGLSTSQYLTTAQAGVEATSGTATLTTCVMNACMEMCTIAHPWPPFFMSTGRVTASRSIKYGRSREEDVVSTVEIGQLSYPMLRQLLVLRTNTPQCEQVLKTSGRDIILNEGRVRRSVVTLAHSTLFY